MAIDLGGWGWAVNMALDYGAPALATAFGVPGPVSAFAIGALKRALGLSDAASEEEVKRAATANPETAKTAFEVAQAETTAKFAFLTRFVEVQGEVAKANVEAIGVTQRAEIAQGVSWWHWRHLIGYVTMFQGVVFVIGSAKIMFFGGDIPAIAALVTAITPIFLGLAALNGYVASDSTALKVAAITGQQPQGVVATAVKAATAKK